MLCKKKKLDAIINVLVVVVLHAQHVGWAVLVHVKVVTKDVQKAVQESVMVHAVITVMADAQTVVEEVVVGKKKFLAYNNL
jgi:hypothetical protein